MASYGDYPEHIVLRLDGGATELSTAILRVYVSEGFVVGADGRQTKEPNEQVVSNETQKIFPIADENKQLGYALTGTHLFTSSDEREILWDLRIEMENAIREIGGRRSSNLTGYAVRLSRPIQRALAQQANKIGEFPKRSEHVDPYGTTIADVLMDGYYFGVPSRVRIRFFHNDQRLCPPQVFTEDVQPFRLDVYGSSKILHAFNDVTDPRLSAFRLDNQRSVNEIYKFVNMMAGYIAACSSQEGKEIDEHAHKIIGGRPHIAIITPDGFRWASGYEPRSQDASSGSRL